MNIRARAAVLIPGREVVSTLVPVAVRIPVREVAPILAQEVAPSLFESGVEVVAITCRESLHCDRQQPVFPRNEKNYLVLNLQGYLEFQIGFCHPVELATPKGVKVDIQAGATRGNDVPARFTLSSIDKRLLGQFAADIRKIRPPEPYKGKGIRYADEHVRRKVGKAFASGAA